MPYPDNRAAACVPSKEDIENLRKTNPVVSRWFSIAAGGGITYDEMLRGMVVSLARHADCLIAAAVQAREKSVVPDSVIIPIGAARIADATLPEPYPHPRFFLLLRVHSNRFSASFVFTGQEQKNEWLRAGFESLQEKYGPLEYDEEALPGLMIGDKCRVLGDGSDVYTIEGLTKYEEHRYGFILDSGFVEEVAKCYEPSYT